MEQKKFEKRLDEVAEKFSKTLSEAVKRMEEAFEKSKESLRETTNIPEKTRSFLGSPTGGVIIVFLGIAWLLYTLGIFKHPLFPIILIIVGLYLILRRRTP